MSAYPTPNEIQIITLAPDVSLSLGMVDGHSEDHEAQPLWAVLRAGDKEWVIESTYGDLQRLSAEIHGVLAHVLDTRRRTAMPHVPQRPTLGGLRKRQEALRDLQR